MEGVAIRRCTALQGIGGGLLAAGGRLTIAGKSSLGHTFDNDASVVVEYNRARKGKNIYSIHILYTYIVWVYVYVRGVRVRMYTVYDCICVQAYIHVHAYIYQVVV